MSMALQYSYNHRFQILFVTQIIILFGSLILPVRFFELNLGPVFFWLNMGAAILVGANNRHYVLIIVLLVLASIILDTQVNTRQGDISLNLGEAAIHLAIYSLLVLQIIRQLWNAHSISNNVIFGAMSGYLSLGILAFLLFMSIELAVPGSFIVTYAPDTGLGRKEDSMLYFAFISLLTVGYGDVAPVTAVAQKATMLTGLMGHFYTVIVTAIIVGKFLQNTGSPRPPA